MEATPLVYQNVLEALGNTPLIKLSRMVPAGSADVLVKYEAVNIGGSIKTRTAYNMIADAELQGILTPDTIIVEPTSGNQGIGLALVGAVRGYKVKIIMPDSVSEERRKLVEHYGAEVVLVHDNGNIGLCIEECLQLALKMKYSRLSSAYIILAMLSCFRLLMHLAARPLSLAEFNAGSSIPARMAMMAITTRSSISVNADRHFPDTKIFAGIRINLFFILHPVSCIFHYTS
jgi:hypothetical protein